MKRKIIPAILILIGTVSAAVYHFTIEGSVEVSRGEIMVTPKSFTAKVRSGAVYVKEVTVKNYGPGKSVYFETIVEGPEPSAVDVEVHDKEGNTITSSNKLILPEGTESSPGTVDVNIHISVKDDAASGQYTVYVMVKETQSG